MSRGDTAMYKHILLPTDGSELSERAAREGVRFAKSINARITALHTTPVFNAPELSGHAVYDRILEHKELSNQKAQEALSAVERIARDADVAFTAVHRVSDNPWEVIISVAQEQGCDLIFMASHGRRGINALLMGSETNKVLIHSKAPVLVCR